RKMSSSLSQLCTGHTFLNANRFKSGFVNSPSCDACGAVYETRAHFLLKCPIWEPFCRPLHTASHKARFFGPLHLTPLLSEPKILKAIAGFIEATGRFE
ncbi:hypothetical protein B0H19DRAFT_947973, partial [Mycena capillaripes]